MKFGKLNDISGVDFTLPPDNSATHRLLQKTENPPSPLRVYVGCPAWSCKEWVGTYYPPKTKPADYLYHYSRQFNTIELNTTHYRIPTIETIRRWKAATPEGFTFCPKLPQSISHRKQFQGVKQALLQFAESVFKLEATLGITFMQLPPYFTPEEQPALEAFLADFPKEIPLAIEFRHEAWFASPERFEAMCQTLESRAISTVITDVAGRRDVLHQRLTTPTLVLRLVGNNLHATDFERAKAWVEKLATWHSMGLQTAYIFVHEPDDVHCPEFATALIEKLNARLGLRVQPPQRLQIGMQGSLF